MEAGKKYVKHPSDKALMSVLVKRGSVFFWDIAGMDDPWRGSPFGSLIILFGDQGVKQVKSN